MNRYPTHKGLMYRFGWRKTDKIEYYSEFLGVRDELTDGDMIIAEDKPKLYQLEEENKSLKNKMDIIERSQRQIVKMLEGEMMGEYELKENPKKISKKEKDKLSKPFLDILEYRNEKEVKK